MMGFIHELLVMNVRATIAAAKAEAEGLCGPRCVRLVLLVFDRHISDILLKDELDRLVRESGGFLTVIHSITGGPDELTDAHTSSSQVSHYLLGRVSEEIILTAFAHLEGQKLLMHQIAPPGAPEEAVAAAPVAAAAAGSRSSSVASPDAIGFGPIASAVASGSGAGAGSASSLPPPSPSLHHQPSFAVGATPAVEMTLHDGSGGLAGSPPPSESVWSSNSVGSGGVAGASVGSSGTSFPAFGSALGRPSVLSPISTRTSVNAPPTAVPAGSASPVSPSSPVSTAVPRASWLRDPPRVFMCGPIDFMRSTCGVLDDLKFDMARVECL